MSSSVSAAQHPADARRRGRLTALLLLAVALVPVVAALAAYLFWTPSSINYGELIEPQVLPDVRMTATNGQSFSTSQLRKRWVLVQIGNAACDDACVRRHFNMRQVRLMQGRHMDRVERLWLILDEGQPDPKLMSAYEGMHVARAPRTLLNSFPAPDDPTQHIYLVDPLGNVMLRFPREPDARRMHKDLSRLLYASRVG